MLLLTKLWIKRNFLKRVYSLTSKKKWFLTCHTRFVYAKTEIYLGSEKPDGGRGILHRLVSNPMPILLHITLQIRLLVDTFFEKVLLHRLVADPMPIPPHITLQVRLLVDIFLKTCQWPRLARQLMPIRIMLPRFARQPMPTPAKTCNACATQAFRLKHWQDWAIASGSW